ncbi:MAG: hypothetical protein HY565_02970 [Candidatus Kerfeldbacteria bacterium]|nr:hypothetical protein [Candidatus Kerfeldbacteria bacterium]
MKKIHLSLGAIVAAGLLTIGAGCFNTTTTPTTTNQPAKTTVTNTAKTADTATTTVTFNATASNSAVESDANGQWATTATASSEYGSDSWSAEQVTKAPNVDSYGDNGYAWAPLELNKGEETLEVTFTKAVNAVGLRILESYGAGTVTLVELKDIDGNYYTAWEGTDTTSGLDYLQVPVTLTTYEVNGARITLDTTLSPEEWVEIDAVQLVGQ